MIDASSPVLTVLSCPVLKLRIEDFPRRRGDDKTATHTVQTRWLMDDSSEPHCFARAILSRNKFVIDGGDATDKLRIRPFEDDPF